MSRNSRSAPDGFTAPGTVDRVEFAEAGQYVFAQGPPSGSQHVGGGGGMPGSSRKKRRRQRPQRGKRRGPGQTARAPHIEVGSRERMFQDIEGLLRQIREHAEETAAWTAEQLQEFTQTVTGFTRMLEAEAEPLPERVRSEYHRIRDKLSQALRG